MAGKQIHILMHGVICILPLEQKKFCAYLIYKESKIVIKLRHRGKLSMSNNWDSPSE